MTRPCEDGESVPHPDDDHAGDRPGRPAWSPARALERWAIRQPTLTRVAGGANDVFRVEPGPFALRIQPRSRMSDEAAASQLDWLRALAAESEVRVPEPIPLPDGEPFLAVGEHRYVLLRWIEGTSLLGLPRVQAGELVGRSIGRLHAHSRSWTPPMGFSCPAHELELPSREALGLPPEDHALLLRARSRVGDAMDLLGRGRATHGLVHGDLSFQNFVLCEGEACPIDFDEFGSGYFLSDLAEPLRVIEFLPDREEIRAALLEGYRREQPLSGRDEGLLDLFILGSYLSVMAWSCRPESAPRRHEISRWIPDWLETIRRQLD